LRTKRVHSDCYQRRLDAERPLREAWEEQAEEWTRWARMPGHDSYWLFHRDRFLELIPEPGRLTLDLGCGEGRLTRDLKARGHRAIGLDVSSTMITHAREADPGGEYLVADGAAIPLEDGAADLVVAFMSLHDMDEMPTAVAEASRVLAPGGLLCAAVVHPINSAGRFESDAPDSPFVIRDPYFDRRRYSDRVERAGLPMVFHSRHWTTEDYSRALEDAGLVIERLREITDPDHPRWSRIPLFLQLRARRP
jgi:ubiquinone/menaquinone biosynthesis C-methylase UbiE